MMVYVLCVKGDLYGRMASFWPCGRLIVGCSTSGIKESTTVGYGAAAHTENEKQMGEAPVLPFILIYPLSPNLS